MLIKIYYYFFKFYFLVLKIWLEYLNKYTQQFSTEFPTEPWQVAGLIESTVFKSVPMNWLRSLT